MITTEYQISTETKLKRIAWLSSQDKGKRFNNLMHLFKWAYRVNDDILSLLPYRVRCGSNEGRNR